MWRGLVCGDGPFGCAPVFDLREAWEARRAAAEAQGSNPERPELRHDASLLVTEGQLELLWRLRAAALEGRQEHCCEFVANPRDFPLLLAVREASGEAVAALPVLSQYSVDGADLRLPALEDYVRAWPGWYFAAAPAKALPQPPPWEQRRACAVFRGGATGAGVTPATNLRLRLAQLSEAWRGTRYHGLLDARLTGWNQRQKLGHDGVVRVLDPGRARAWRLGYVGKGNYLDYGQQAAYKYAVYLEGNVGASRLGALLGLGFVVLAPPPEGPCTWLWTELVPWRHYVPLRPDLSDLGLQLLRLRADDARAWRVSEAARELWARRCGRDACEARAAQLLAALPPAEDARARGGLRALWEHARSGVYCLVDRREGRLLLWVPFANEAFATRRAWRTEPAPLGRFLAEAERLTGERVELPPERWWTNGALVCNVPHPQVWGEGLLPALRLLLQRAAPRLLQ